MGGGGLRGGVYQDPVKHHERFVAVETVVDAWNHAAKDGEDDSKVVELVSEAGDGWAVVGDCVVCGAHCEACGFAEEEGADYELVGEGGGGIAGGDGMVEVEAGEEEADGAEEVSVDVDGFVVEVEEGAEGAAEGEGLGTVAADDKVVVSWVDVRWGPWRKAGSEGGELTEARPLEMGRSRQRVVRDRWG